MSRLHSWRGGGERAPRVTESNLIWQLWLGWTEEPGEECRLGIHQKAVPVTPGKHEEGCSALSFLEGSPYLQLPCFLPKLLSLPDVLYVFGIESTTSLVGIFPKLFLSYTFQILLVNNLELEREREGEEGGRAEERPGGEGREES